MLIAALLGLRLAAAADVLTLPYAIEPEALDWNKATHAATSLILKNVMEGLTEFDAEMNVRPRLAQSIAVSPDGLTYTFKLRPEVKWSDGRGLTAEDFVASWRRLLEPLTAAPYAGLLSSVTGAADFHAGRLTDFAKVGVKALDRETLQVTLSHPCAFFPQLLAFWATFPLRADLLEKFGEAWSKLGNLVVLGPYLVASHEKGGRIVLKRNSTYAGSRPEVDEVRLEFVADSETERRLFLAGKLDTCSVQNAAVAQEVSRAGQVRSAPVPRTQFLEFNHARYPLGLVKARQAIALAVDRSKIAAALHEEIPPATSFVVPSLLKGSSAAAPPFEPARARALWKEAGLADNLTVKLELVGLGSDRVALAASFIRDQLAANLGIKVEVHLGTTADYYQRLQTKAGDLFLSAWSADYLDPQTFLEIFQSTSSHDQLGWKNVKYDELVSRLAVIAPGSERTGLVEAALKILQWDDPAVVPLYYEKRTYAVGPRFEGYVITTLGDVFLRKVRPRRQH